MFLQLHRITHVVMLLHRRKVYASFAFPVHAFCKWTSKQLKCSLICSNSLHMPNGTFVSIVPVHQSSTQHGHRCCHWLWPFVNSIICNGDAKRVTMVVFAQTLTYIRLWAVVLKSVHSRAGRMNQKCIQYKHLQQWHLTAVNICISGMLAYCCRCVQIEWDIAC